jgi:hypothetical protein
LREKKIKSKVIFVRYLFLDKVQSLGIKLVMANRILYLVVLCLQLKCSYQNQSNQKKEVKVFSKSKKSTKSTKIKKIKKLKKVVKIKKLDQRCESEMYELSKLKYLEFSCKDKEKCELDYFFKKTIAEKIKIKNCDLKYLNSLNKESLISLEVDYNTIKSQKDLEMIFQFANLKVLILKKVPPNIKLNFRNIENLKKLEILEGLTLNETDFKYILNLKIKKLSFWNRNLSILSISKLKNLKTLENLEIIKIKLNDKILKSISSIKNIKRLKFRYCSFKKINIKILNKFPHLKSVFWKFCKIDNTKVKIIYYSKELNLLDLKVFQTDMTLDSVDEIKNIQLNKSIIKLVSSIKTLKELRIKGVNFIGLSLLPIYKMKKLEKIRFEYCEIDNVAFNGIQKLRSLKKLWFSICKVKKSFLKAVSKNSNIEDIYFRFIDLTKSKLKSLTYMKNLKKLELIENKIVVSDFKYFSKISNLQNFSFQGFANNSGINSLKNLKKLKKLYIVPYDLRHKSVGNSAFEGFQRLKNLQDLSIDSKNIDNKIFYSICKLKNLKTLGLIDTKVNDKGIECLKNLIQLESLDLTGAKVSMKGLKVLSKLTNLKKLSLSRVLNISDGKLFNTICKLKEIEILWLQNTNTIDKNMECFTKLKNLKELHLLGTKISEKSLKLLINMKNLKIIWVPSHLTEKTIKLFGKRKSKIYINEYPE